MPEHHKSHQEKRVKNNCRYIKLKELLTLNVSDIYMISRLKGKKSPADYGRAIAFLIFIFAENPLSGVMASCYRLLLRQFYVLTP